MCNIFSHRREILELVEVPKLQDFLVWNMRKFTYDHIPSVVKGLQIAALEGQRLEVIHIKHHLSRRSR